MGLEKGWVNGWWMVLLRFFTWWNSQRTLNYRYLFIRWKSVRLIYIYIWKFYGEDVKPFLKYFGIYRSEKQFACFSSIRLGTHPHTQYPHGCFPFGLGVVTKGSYKSQFLVVTSSASLPFELRNELACRRWAWGLLSHHYPIRPIWRFLKWEIGRSPNIPKSG